MLKINLAKESLENHKFTLRRFLLALRAANVEWEVMPNGAIRVASHDNIDVFTLGVAVVDGSPIGSRNKTFVAADALGMKQVLAGRIVAAAEHMDGHDPNLRGMILKACKLTEAK